MYNFHKKNGKKVRKKLKILILQCNSEQLDFQMLIIKKTMFFIFQILDIQLIKNLYCFTKKKQVCLKILQFVNNFAFHFSSQFINFVKA